MSSTATLVNDDRDYSSAIANLKIRDIPNIPDISKVTQVELGSSPDSDEDDAGVNPFQYVGEVLGAGPGPNYPYQDLLPSNPTRTKSDPPLELQEFSDRGLKADPNAARLRAFVQARGGKVKDQLIAIGTVIEGDIKLEELGEAERDDLALLVAQRGVVFFRNQHTMTIDQQRELGAHWGPLHKHATYAVPRRGDLDDVVVVYADHDSRPDLYAFSRAELFHSDVTYELQPPGTTILRLLTTPEVGNDTLWSSGYAVYSSLSKPFQKYLESLSAIHSGFDQASSRTGITKIPRREPIETVHPVVRVHPATGQKSVFVNPGFVTRLVGVPKAESDTILAFLKDSFAQQTDATVRWSWQAGDVAIWDNRIVNHSATFDAYPSLRHGTRVTPIGEKPMGVEEYEERTGEKAKDWLEERFRKLGIRGPAKDDGRTKQRAVRD
ncbi:alpha-ketoglutarate catabolism dioxygenase [Cryptococcus wingfieldii CBS 7118]|uniref:Alpha-ketoglutarate catabolism dioxygenase n=1 Tax=Cryptococcus wingfieldii CBS 7118 TaxID=1295528 RepID=A0A1E3ISC1_9TREE|nr:alpha-ketoglutarate catabolism dioxygenase [Cryptococcus wingfieldii CBS 7118]ODN90816.1 alpha-ketoglutarate catabolism dioxygenase [Cryptococcus wingfieldii CBS 7118]